MLLASISNRFNSCMCNYVEEINTAGIKVLLQLAYIESTCMCRESLFLTIWKLCILWFFASLVQEKLPSRGARSLYSSPMISIIMHSHGYGRLDNNN